MSPTPGEFMRAEIREQPTRWRQLLERQIPEWEAAWRLMRDARPELVAFVARGSSDHAAQYGQYLVPQLLGIPALSTAPSLHSLGDRSVRYPRAVQVALSQSGRSPDLLAAAAALGDSGVPLIAATNDPASELARAARVHLDLGVGAELSVAATKSYTAELLIVRTLMHGAVGRPVARLHAEIEAIADTASEVIADASGAAPALVEVVGDRERVLVVGRGPSMATAREGALKLMETCGVAASGWSAADAAHGPLGQVDSSTVLIALTGGESGRESVLDVAAAAAARGCRVVEIGVGAVRGAPGYRVPSLPPDLEDLLPVLEVIPLQALAAELALRRGRDPDRPPGLSKVTRTR